MVVDNTETRAVLYRLYGEIFAHWAEIEHLSGEIFITCQDRNTWQSSFEDFWNEDRKAAERIRMANDAVKNRYSGDETLITRWEDLVLELGLRKKERNSLAHSTLKEIQISVSGGWDSHLFWSEIHISEKLYTVHQPQSIPAGVKKYYKEDLERLRDEFSQTVSSLAQFSIELMGSEHHRREVATAMLDFINNFRSERPEPE